MGQGQSTSSSSSSSKEVNETEGFTELQKEVFEMTGLKPLDRETASLEDKERYATAILVNELRSIQLKNAEDNKPLEVFDKSGFDDYNYERLDLPIDDEGFVQSFDWQDDENIKAFFDRFGVVVINNILTDEECERGFNEIWDFLERHNPLKRDDPSTWKNWPNLKHLGILGNTFVQSKQFFENRQNPRLYHVFSSLYGSTRLISGSGRANYMRPTRSLPWPADKPLEEDDVVVSDAPEMKDGREWIKIDRPKWKTMDNWLHWDMNPYTTKTTTFGFKEINREANKGYDRPKVQCIMTFVDCKAEDGGFHCVPGFQKHIRSWARANKDRFLPTLFDTTIQVPAEDPIRNDIQKVSARKGSIVIWSSCLPHGTFPNDSPNPRAIQYIHVADLNDPSIGSLFGPEDTNLLPPSKEFEPSPLGAHLFGIQPWD